MTKHLTALGLCVGVGLLLTAWANQAASSTGPRLMLLGEVHDNPDGHRQRADALRAEVEAGFRPALLMEQSSGRRLCGRASELPPPCAR